MDKFRCLGVDEAFLPTVIEGRNLGGYGTLFVDLVFKIPCSYLETIWSRHKELKKEFEYPEDIVDKFRAVHYFMGKGKVMSITPFKGEQLALCRIFGLRPPKLMVQVLIHHMPHPIKLGESIKQKDTDAKRYPYLFQWWEKLNNDARSIP